MYFVVKVIDFGFWFKLLVTYDSNIRYIVVKVTSQSYKFYNFVSYKFRNQQKLQANL